MEIIITNPAGEKGELLYRDQTIVASIVFEGNIKTEDVIVQNGYNVYIER